MIYSVMERMYAKACAAQEREIRLFDKLDDILIDYNFTSHDHEDRREAIEKILLLIAEEFKGE